MVKNFKGEVKISDVQEEFDNLVDRINNMVYSYNIGSEVEDIDYSVGGVNLSPTGYTLTVGGLKQGLASTERNVIGAKCFKINNTKFKITDGLVITKKGSIRLPDKVINKPSNYHTLYFNSITKDYQWVAGEDWEEEIRVKELNSCNKLDESTGLYQLINPNTGFTYETPFKYWNNAYAPFHFSNLDSNTLSDAIYNSPRFLTDSESLVEKIKLDLPRYQWIPLNESETKLTDITFDMDIGDETYSLLGPSCDGILLGKYNYNDNGSGFNTFDPRIGIVFGQSYTSVDRNSENAFGIQDYMEDASDRFEGGSNGRLSFKRSTGLVTWYHDNNLPNVYPDISHIKITFEEHHNRFMIVMKWTLKTLRYDPYLGDLYMEEGMKYDNDSVYSVTFLDSKYKDVKVGNVSLLSQGYNRYEKSKYQMESAFNPNLYKVNGNSPVTDKANIYYTVLIPTEESEKVFKICDLNMNRDSKFISDINTIQVERFNGKYTITSESKTFGSSGVLRNSNVSRSSNEAIFISGIDAERFEREGTSTVTLLGDTVAWNSQPGHRNLNYWTPVNMLYVPKGISNPFSISNGNASKSFKVIVNKKVE